MNSRVNIYPSWERGMLPPKMMGKELLKVGQKSTDDGLIFTKLKGNFVSSLGSSLLNS